MGDYVEELSGILKGKDPLNMYFERYIYTMLLVELNMVIDNTECVIFSSSNKSLNAKLIEKGTRSLWIYAELMATQMIR